MSDELDPSDSLFSEDFEIDGLDPSSPSSLFADWKPPSADDVELVDIDDEEEQQPLPVGGRPAPSFGPLVEEDEPPRPVFQDVFEPDESTAPGGDPTGPQYVDREEEDPVDEYEPVSPFAGGPPAQPPTADPPVGFSFGDDDEDEEPEPEPAQPDPAPAPTGKKKRGRLRGTFNDLKQEAEQELAEEGKTKKDKPPKQPKKAKPKKEKTGGLAGIKQKVADAREAERQQKEEDKPSKAPEPKKPRIKRVPKPDPQEPATSAAPVHGHEPIDAGGEKGSGLLGKLGINVRRADEPTVNDSPYEVEEPQRKLSWKDKIAVARGENLDDQPAEVQPPVVDFGAEESQGFSGKIRSRLAMAEQAAKKDKDPAAGAGVDVSAPGLLARLTGRGPKSSATTATERSEFEKLLTPLGDAELQRLQQEVQEEETIFARIKTARRRAIDWQRFGFFMGLVTVVMFSLGVGTHYLTDTLPNAPVPSWVPADDETATEAFGAGMFALGLLLPLLAVPVIADAVLYLWRGATDRRIDDLALALTASICVAGMLTSLMSGFPLSAAMFLFTWVAIRGVAAWILRVFNRRGR